MLLPDAATFINLTRNTGIPILRRSEVQTTEGFGTNRNDDISGLHRVVGSKVDSPYYNPLRTGSSDITLRLPAAATFFSIMIWG